MKNTSPSTVNPAQPIIEPAEITAVQEAEHDEESLDATSSSKSVGEDTFGRILKKARIARKLTIPMVAKHLRISEHYITAIETNNFAQLPERVYTLGFIRSYSRYLGFQGEEVVEVYKQQCDQGNQEALIFPVPRLDKAIPKVWLVAGSALLALVIMLLWYTIMNASNPASPVAEVQTAPTNTVAPSASESSLEVPTKVEETAGPSSQSSEELKQTFANSLPNAAEMKNKILLSKGETLTLEANDYTWVGIKNLQGKVLFNKTLSPNSKEEVVVNEPLKLTTGNAGGLSLRSPKHVKSPVGQKGQSIHNFEIALNPSK